MLKRGDAMEIADLLRGLHANPTRQAELSAAALAFAKKHFQWSLISLGYRDFAQGLITSTSDDPIPPGSMTS